jgi:exosortase
MQDPHNKKLYQLKNMQLEDFKKYIPHKNLLNGLALVSTLIILFWPIFPALYHDWIEYNNNSHGMLVPFISMYLIWSNRHSIDLGEVCTSYIGLCILVISLMIYVIGYAGRIDVLPRLAFVTSLLGIVCYNYGRNVFLKLAFPLFFLYFMIPVPVSIESIVSFKLQSWVTQISSTILSFLSIAVLREGNILQFANCSLEVAEACSGIRSLTAYIMLGCLFGYIMEGSLLRRSIMILSAVPLAIFVNIARVVGTGILANYYGSHIARGFLHEFSGIIVFIVGFLLFLLIYRVVEK